MESRFLIPIIISAISLIISGISVCLSIKAQRKANLVSIGGLEKSLRELISHARRNMEDRSLFLTGLIKDLMPEMLDKNRHIKIASLTYKSAVEDWLNAYEEACSKYLNGVIDKLRFRITYKREIRNIIETSQDTQTVNELIHPEGTSPYKALWKVYREFKNEE